MPVCDRCRKSAQITTMSRFNTQMICMSCESTERKHPAYAAAAEAERLAVLRGNYNFPGVGLPKDL